MKLTIVFIVALCGTVSCIFHCNQTWQEHWEDHKSLVKLQYENVYVCIYFDSDVDKNVKWPSQFLTDSWYFTSNSFGFLGDPLYAIFHAGKHAGGEPATYLEALKDNKSVLDSGMTKKNAWVVEDDNARVILLRQVAYIIEFAAKRVKGSPANALWKTQFQDFMICIILDNLKGAKYQQARTRCFDTRTKNAVSYPRANTFWFRDWFLHLYNNFGKIEVINNFFELLAVYFPKANKGCPYRSQYARNLNWGEFFHFWSGAARTNLKTQATKAFGWSSQTQAQFQKAQTDFPLIVYKN